LVATLGSCGYAEVAEQLGPSNKTRVEGPGVRLAQGSFRKLRYVIDADAWYLCADTDAGRAVTVFNVLQQRQCEIPAVTSYSLYHRTAQSPQRVLPYLTAVDTTTNRGTLKFVNMDCQSMPRPPSPADPPPPPLEVPDAELPLDSSSPRGFAVKTGTQLVLADPLNGTTQTLIERPWQIERAAAPTDKPGWIVRNDTEVVLFDSDWNERVRLGDGANNLVNNLYFVDRAGLERIDAEAGTAMLVRADVCSVRNRLSDTPATLIYFSPCADRKLVIWEPSTDEIVEPSVSVDPNDARYLKVGAERWLFFARDVGGVKELHALALTPDGTELTIGPRPDLDWTEWDEYQAGSPPGARADLLAYLDLSGELGRLVAWQQDGTTRDLATGVWRWSRWIPDLFGERSFLANFDGTAGDLITVCRKGSCATDPPDAPAVVRRVPKPGNLAVGDDASGRPVLMLGDFDGTVGALYYAASTSGARQPFAAIAQRVPPERFALLSKYLFKGAVYLADYDSASMTGRLEYRSFELDAVGTIAPGVSEFLEVPLPDFGLLYATQDGIWYARSK
jgi:hypothetical protein